MDGDEVVMKKVAVAVLWLGVGLILGGYLFRGVQPRSVLALPQCDATCYRPSDLIGLLASIGVQRVPGLVPGIVKESERCITIRHPNADGRVHFVSFPKRDIKDIGSLSPEDGPYVMECLGHIQALIAENNLHAYSVVTNGPGRQVVRYLHLHLVSR
jgi:scavenger mRNA decapping enzyme DcpS-like protein